MGRGFGIPSQILISIYSSCRDQALRIHRGLFGSDLSEDAPEERFLKTEPDEN